jgi:hypothetical protein
MRAGFGLCGAHVARKIYATNGDETPTSGFRVCPDTKRKNCVAFALRDFFHGT